jgi:hypothetical protein
MIMVLLVGVDSIDKILVVEITEVPEVEIIVVEVEITVVELAVEETIVVEAAMAVEEITTTVILKKGTRKAAPSVPQGGSWNFVPHFTPSIYTKFFYSPRFQPWEKRIPLRAFRNNK